MPEAYWTTASNPAESRVVTPILEGERLHDAIDDIVRLAMREHQQFNVGHEVIVLWKKDLPARELSLLNKRSAVFVVLYCDRSDRKATLLQLLS